ncbi:MAG: ABC transporter permease [Chloroflexi bacterium]|nr:ABC transporter permease [Chloroflexota bacterium]
MIRQIYHIAREYLRTTYSSRVVLIFALLMPLAFTAVLGSAMNAFFMDDESVRWPVAVVDEDEGVWGEALVERLQAHPQLAVELSSRAEAQARVDDEDLVAAIIIPADFSQTLAAGRDPTILLYPGPHDLQAIQSVERVARASASRLAGEFQAAHISLQAARKLNLFERSNLSEEAYLREALARVQTRWAESAPVSLEVRPVTALAGSGQLENGFQQSSPGMLVTFALAFLLNGAIALILEREQGTLRRLLVMPLRKSSILTGKLAGIFAAGLAQSAALILAGRVLFGVNWGQSPLALALMVVTFSFALTGMGMMIAGVARTYAQANALANIFMYSTAALGGAWWPVEITPEWMQRLAQVTPAYWAMQGFHDIITRGLGVDAVLPEALMLTAFGLGFLAVGAWRFRYE